jgi:hypothetical protein
MSMNSGGRKRFSVSVLALCGAVLWGLVETLALFRSRWAARGKPSV